MMQQSLQEDMYTAGQKSPAPRGIPPASPPRSGSGKRSVPGSSSRLPSSCPFPPFVRFCPILRTGCFPGRSSAPRRWPRRCIPAPRRSAGSPPPSSCRCCGYWRRPGRRRCPPPGSPDTGIRSSAARCRTGRSPR